jgi:hypothetical protein
MVLRIDGRWGSVFTIRVILEKVVHVAMDAPFRCLDWRLRWRSRWRILLFRKRHGFALLLVPSFGTWVRRGLRFTRGAVFFLHGEKVVFYVG